MNTKGKTLTIFLVLISVLLLSLTVIAIFFFQKENEMRKLAEVNLQQSKDSEAKLQGDLKEAKKQVFLLEEKAKEAEEKISDLQSDLELAQGVRDRIKQENDNLNQALKTETQAKEELRAQMDKELTEAKNRVSEIQAQLDSQQKERLALEEKLKTLEGAANNAEPQPAVENVPAAAVPAVVPVVPTEPEPQSSQELAPEAIPAPQAKADNEVQLGTIVVGPDQNQKEGKILSVDKENDFIIFDLGERDGIAQGTIMSIYRGKDYLGDVKVSKVQSDMAAADFIPPFSSQKVRKSDQIVVKK